MNSYIFSFIVLIGYGRTPEVHKTDTALSGQMSKEIVQTISVNSMNDSEEIKFQIETLNENQFLLKVTKVLSEGNCLLGSPHYRNSPVGYFKIVLQENDQVILGNSPYDVPSTLAEVNPEGNDPSSVYNRTIKASKLLKLASSDSFEVGGMVQFITEHEYVLEEIDFTISYTNGEMKIIKVNTNK